jgi:hypothetical protein
VFRLTVKRFVAAARLLAGVMAVTIFLVEMLCVDGEFHRSLHHSSTGGTSSCVLCLFVHGQVNLSDTTPIAPGAIHFPFQAAPRIESVAMPDLSYLASLGRAPPSTPLLSAVVG